MDIVNLKAFYKKYEVIIKYLFIGVLTTIVSLGTYYIGVSTVFNPDEPLQLQCANILSWISAVTFAYITNRCFVFKSKNQDKFTEAFRFYSSRIVTLLIDMSIMFVLVSILHFNDKFVKLLIQVIVTIGNYILSKFLVFK